MSIARGNAMFLPNAGKLSLNVEHASDGVDNVEGLGYGELLEGVAVRGGDVGTSHTQDGSIQVVKCST